MVKVEVSIFQTQAVLLGNTREDVFPEDEKESENVGKEDYGGHSHSVEI
jgi:hypothetical protein